MNVKYVSPAKDYSGYGEASRHDIAALVAAEVGVTTKIPMYVMEISDFGELGEIATSRENAPLPYDIVILHTTPNVYRTYIEKDKYHIGRVFWETNKIPQDFAVNCQLMDELWTGSEFNAQAIRNAGVTKPIHIIPEAIDDTVDVDQIKPYIVENEVFNMGYKFYSIFEWTERKNPTALLTAYFMEFQNNEEVSLSIKTYVDNFTPDKKQIILDEISKIKARLQLPKYPKLYIFRNLMDRNQIYRFHKTFDCFVSAHRGEGWGIPQMEALYMNKPIISTNRGGIHEYIHDGEEGLLVKNELIPLKYNTRNADWYSNDQQWADVDISSLRQAMRAVYSNKQKAQEMGIKGGQLVHNTFGLQVVGEKMKTRLENIYKTTLK